MALRGVLLDIAGVLYEGRAAIPGARAALAALRQTGLPLRCVTNTSRQPARLLRKALGEFGFDIAEEEIFTATRALVAHLRAHALRPLLLVHPALDEEFAGLQQDPCNAVVVGDAAERFTYEGLNAAFRLILDGAPLLAIAANRYFRDDDAMSLDAGPFVAALEYAARTRAVLFGKPAPAFFHAVLADLRIDPQEAVMIGDDVEADVNGALAAGIPAILVRTGKYRAGDEQRASAGGRCAASLREAVDTLFAPTAP